MSKVFDIPLVLNRDVYRFKKGDRIMGSETYGGWYIECKDGTADYYLVLHGWVEK